MARSEKCKDPRVEERGCVCEASALEESLGPGLIHLTGLVKVSIVDQELEALGDLFYRFFLLFHHVYG